MKKDNTKSFKMTIGLDLGDRKTHGCILDDNGEVGGRFRVATDKMALTNCFEQFEPVRVVLEVGTHSPWISRLLTGLGHEVIVANAYQVKLIHKAYNKNDKRDAEFLARLGRADVKLLAPIEHRGERAQAHRVMISSRNSLVETRTKLINHVRGSVKAFGERLPSCSAAAFAKKVGEAIPQYLRQSLEPIVKLVGDLTAMIRDYDARLEALAAEEYPETKRLREISGVGLLTSLAFVLTIEDPNRFAKSRDVGPYLGLVPRQSSSGESTPQLRITKAGDDYLRKLLVTAANYILGPFGSDCDLRRHGEKIAARGGGIAKKKGKTAVARKLAVMMHRLWVSGSEYDPFYNLKKENEKVKQNQTTDLLRGTSSITALAAPQV